MPSAGLAGKRIAPDHAPDHETRIIKESDADPTGKHLSPERTQEIKMYNKSKEAKYYVLKQTQESLNWIRTQHRKNQPQSAIDMKTRKEQFAHLRNKSMFTKPMRPTVKPVEPKRVYHSNKLKSRPGTASRFGSYRKHIGESTKTLSGQGMDSEPHFLPNQHLANYAAYVP